MLITSDLKLFQALENKLNIRLVESTGWADADGKIPVDRSSITSCIEIRYARIRMYEVSYNYKVLKKKIITPHDIQLLSNCKSLLKMLLSFYEISESAEITHDNLSDLSMLAFKTEWPREFENRCYESFNGKDYILLSPYVKEISHLSQIDNDFRNCETTQNYEKIKLLLSEIVEYTPIIQKLSKHIRINKFSNYIDDLVSLNEERFEHEEKIESQKLENMFDEIEEDKRRWDEEDPFWRVANDLD